MIDFKNSSFLKLKAISNEDGEKAVSNMLIDGESIFASFKTVRDMVIFTNKRIISINAQGITGTKKRLYFPAVQQSTGIFSRDVRSGRSGL